MGIPDSAGRELTLADIARGKAARVVQIAARSSGPLAAQGIFVGRVVAVETDAPLGGPRIVRLGGARLALARSVARDVLVEVDAGGDEAA